MAKKVTGLKIDLQNGTTNTLYASWTALNDTNLDHYTVNWTYATGDGVWFTLEESDISKASGVTTDTCSIPDNATKVRVKVKPVAKTTTKNGKEIKAWEGENVSKEWYTKVNPPEKPDNPPDYELDGMVLTLSYTVTDPKVDGIVFQVLKDGVQYAKKEIAVIQQKASWTVRLSGTATAYTVRCRAINDYKLNGKNSVSRSEWSDFSDEIKIPPLVPTNLKVVRDGKSSVKLTWKANGSKATGYNIEYTTDAKYFDSGSNVTTHSVGEFTSTIITGIEIGQKWFFRIRAKNEAGESAWSKSKACSIVLGEKPSPPTTWSSTNTAYVGEKVTLYWTHNSEDGSRLEEAYINLLINGEESNIRYINSDPEDYDLGYYFQELNLSSYPDGATILWKVKAKGIDDEWSDWSTQREISVYAPPTVTMNMNDILAGFPFSIGVSAEPTTQIPVSWGFTVTAETGYMGTNAKGEEIYIAKGTVLHSFVMATSGQSLTYNLSPRLITLEDGETYKVTVTVAMNSGLTAEASDTFTVQWSDNDYSPDLGWSYDEDSLTMLLYPYCEDESGNYISDVTLSVYRRDYDGSFTEIGKNLKNDGAACITDDHPSLDMARYRVVATSTSTGQMGYSDIPGIPINEPSIVIQWDETHVDYNFAEDAEPVEPAWSGSMVKIPYNVDVSEAPSPDVSLVSYIGRRSPVSYYGTLINEAANWSCVIPKEDTATLYQLRRLAAWMGDCYVREPSGVGYNAHVQVSIDNKHKEVTIPVKFSVTRVEGGK